MQRALRLAGAGAWIFAVTLSGVASARPSAGQSLETRVEQYLEPYLETGNFSGSILIARHGSVLFSQGYGSADRGTGLENKPNTVFHLASVSRVVTSTAILVLEERGLLAIDDRLSDHLPGWPRGDEITIHDLLTLSAGFPNINSLPGYWRWQQSPQTPESLASKFRHMPLEFEPGSSTVHSNSNYVVLALLIERVSGQSFGDFLADAIFEPLHMRSSAHDSGADRPGRQHAVGYAPAGRAETIPALEIDWTVKAGHGSLVSTTEDLLRLDRALAEARVLTAGSVERTFTEHFARHGYGWFIRQLPGDRVVYINGGSPGFGAYWGRAEVSGVTVIVLGNIYNQVPNAIGGDLMSMMLEEEYERPTILSESPPDSVLREVVGSYQFGPDFYRPDGVVRVRHRDGHLFSGADWLMPTTSGDLIFVHRRYWSKLEFHRGPDGRVVKLRFDDYVGRRIGR